MKEHALNAVNRCQECGANNPSHLIWWGKGWGLERRCYVCALREERTGIGLAVYYATQVADARVMLEEFQWGAHEESALKGFLN